jgi:cytochrome c-type biogenesis protein CcmH
MRRALAALIVLALCAPALAVNPSEMLADPALEARARAISSELRCLVCQNQNIEDSDADLAHELRVLVRERVSAGDTDSEVKQFVVDRYGEFVLLRPVFAWHTALLWAAGPVLLLAGAVALVIGVRRRRRTAVPTPAAEPLSAEEEAALRRLASPDTRTGNGQTLTES